jgi:hypothetical protein
MNKQKTLPEYLVELLKGGQTHVDLDGAVKDWPANLQGKAPKGAAHSGWELPEHMRIAQWDIPEFTRNPKHVSPEFPAGYWPKTQAPPDKNVWRKSVDAFRADRKAMIEIVENESTDLYAITKAARGAELRVEREGDLSEPRERFGGIAEPD